jgi:hypothetical protein
MSEEQKELNVPKAPKAPKKQKEQKKECNVPTRANRIPCVLWAIHIHNVLRDITPELLKEEPVIDAYNQFVACLRKYEGVITTLIPNKWYKYEYGILLQYDATGNATIEKVPFLFVQRRDNLDEISRNIIKSYEVLYVLIREKVEPIIHQKLEEAQRNEKRVNLTHRLKSHKKRMEALIHRQIEMSKRYEDNMKQIQKDIERVEEQLDKL